MLDSFKGAIFDMDGTLVDSMWIWGKIDEDYLRKHGAEVPEDLHDAITSFGFYETALYFKKRFSIADTPEEIMEEWNNMALHEYTYNVKLKPGAKEYLNFLKAAGVRIALATSNSKPLLELALSHNNVLHLFDTIVTTDEVKRSKNFPDVYLLAAERLCITPADCVVFEDILPAVMGAKAAGMRVVGVYDEAAAYQKDDILLQTDYYIYDFNCLMKNT